MRILIKNIRGLALCTENPTGPVKGADMDNLPLLENSFLAIEDGRIMAYGSMEDWGGITDWRDLEVFDAEGRYVLPAWCDSHTHTVFAATREEEFVDRIKGLSYEEIALRGGGILNSARRMQDASEDDLYEAAFERLNRMMRKGTGAVEIKSGYGLTTEAELKMLRVIKRLKENHPLTIKATFLGAHAFPADHKEDHQGYIKKIIDEMIPTIQEEGLAEYIDAFCERNYFSLEETEQVLEAGVAAGLKPKVHVNQFSSMGGVAKAVEYGAVSVDHLEEMTAGDIEALTGSETMATLLPSCSFFLNIPFGPARKLIEHKIPMAIATDFNPGSTPSYNMQLLIALACIKLRMTPNEAIQAATLNGAHAMELGDELGSITPGKKANVLITERMDNLSYIPYSFGENHIATVIVNGKPVYGSDNI